ncbi:hypothetical protein FNV43_RR00568 [Rhamnella rubrinervis]|uniref:Uncharacterized protein n=1 Tax=Rhamnella rubrinervis TaxID=2594499 RepID=A0A8K0HQM7_9ROSA|nr:hypothetical protein FNV43_RR00568 [Rhamnella rubrinervis]
MLGEWWDGNLVFTITVKPNSCRARSETRGPGGGEEHVQWVRRYTPRGDAEGKGRVAEATAMMDQELHKATLKNLAYGFAYLVDCQRLQKGLFRNWILL